MKITGEPRERNKVVDKRAENRGEEVRNECTPGAGESEIGNPTREESRTKSARRKEIRPKNASKAHPTGSSYPHKPSTLPLPFH